MRRSVKQISHYSCGRWKSRRLRQAERERWRTQGRACAVRVARLLASEFQVERVCLIGSLARSEPLHDRPDIDVVVYGLSQDRFWEALSAASEVALPYELDLITIEEATPSIREAARRGEVLFDAKALREG